MDNPWVQSIGGSLIAVLIVGVAGLVLKRARRVLFSISVSTVIFMFGTILEPATRYVLEGQLSSFAEADRVRQSSPTLFFISLFLSGLFPGLITGISILRARSFQQRIAYSAFWAVISLILWDVIGYTLAFRMRVGPTDWSMFYFSVICDLFGGVVAGVIIGSLLHFFDEVTSRIEGGLTPVSFPVDN